MLKPRKKPDFASYFEVNKPEQKEKTLEVLIYGTDTFQKSFPKTHGHSGEEPEGTGAAGVSHGHAVVARVLTKVTAIFVIVVPRFYWVLAWAVLRLYQYFSC